MLLPIAPPPCSRLILVGRSAIMASDLCYLMYSLGSLCQVVVRVPIGACCATVGQTLGRPSVTGVGVRAYVQFAFAAA